MPAELGVRGDVRRRISRGIVNLIKDQFGRGPSNARTFINHDVITVVLEDSLTQVERTLVSHGESGTVNDVRHDSQSAFCADAVALVERETGFRVKAFLSDHSVISDFAAECFILDLDQPASETDAPCEERDEQEG